MRKNWRQRTNADRRGKITSGTKTTSKSGKEIPKSLDYFNVEPFDELVRFYGEKPNKLFICFGTDNMNLFLQTEYVLYGKSAENTWKIRSCDGEIRKHLVPEELNGKKYKAGEEGDCFGCGLESCKLDPKHQCRCFTGFNAYIFNPDTGLLMQYLPYRFQTNSVNSGDNILSILNIVFSQFGKIPPVQPYELSVEMVEKQTPDGKKTKFPLWYLRPIGTVEQINEFAKLTSFPTNPDNSKLHKYTLETREGNIGMLVEAPKEMLSEAPKEMSSQEDVPVGVEVNDPYPDDIPDDQTDEGDLPVIPGTNIGILKDIEFDMNDPRQLMKVTLEVIMDMVGGDKDKAKQKLKTYSTDKSRNLYGYTNSKDILDRGMLAVQTTFGNVRKAYHEHLIKNRVEEQQTSIV